MNVFIVKINEILKQFKRKEVGILPTYISFYILLSFIPLLSLVIISLSFINRSNESFLLFINEVFPESVYYFIRQFVTYFNENIEVFTINNVVLLYLASRIYYSIYHSNTVIIKQKCCRSFFYDKLIALLNTFIILVTVLILTVVLILGTYMNRFFIDYLHLLSNFSEIIKIVLSLISVSIFTTLIMMSLPHYEFKFKRVWKGALVSGLLIVFTTYGFKIYVDLFANYENIYHTFSTILIFILWIYIISYAFVIGLIVNYLAEKGKK